MLGPMNIVSLEQGSRILPDRREEATRRSSVLVWARFAIVIAAAAVPVVLSLAPISAGEDAPVRRTGQSHAEAR
jgi:hypothetical protein